MIPQRLSVKNFLSYRENVPALELAGVHVACLCGANGHGKSALLDAITWCLWGKARGRTQDDLISYGADESRVELEFVARDTQYRVIRSHSRGRSRNRPGATDLQLQLLNDGQAQPITGNTVRESQYKIDQLIGMDYDTFINSAFLMQGRADEFTSKTPADRKAVLSSILGLDLYDRLQTRARERVRAIEADSARTEGGLQQVHRQVEDIGDPTEELVGVAKYLADLESQLAEQRTEAESLRNRVNSLVGQRDEQSNLQRQIEELRQDLSQLDSRVSAAEARIQQYQAVLQQSSAIKDGVQRLRESRQQLDTLEQSRVKYDSLNQEKRTLEQSIEGQRVRLQAQAEQLQQRIEQELVPKARAEPTLTSQRSDWHRRAEELAVDEQQIGQQREQQQTLVMSIGEAQSAATRYASEGKEISSKLTLLEGSNQQDAQCPLCQAPLGRDGCQRLAETYQREN